MSEQITDLIESVMPGPRGKQGPEGLRAGSWATNGRLSFTYPSPFTQI